MIYIKVTQELHKTIGNFTVTEIFQLATQQKTVPVPGHLNPQNVVIEKCTYSQWKMLHKLFC